MAKRYYLNEADIAVLRRLIKQVGDLSPESPSRPGTEMSFMEGEDHQAPEVYIAHTQDAIEDEPIEGISKIAGTGTGEGTYDIPGTGKMNIYEIDETDPDNPDIRPLGGETNREDYNIEVFNFNSGPISPGYHLAIKDKMGRWIAVPFAQNLVKFQIIGDHPGKGVLFSCWLGAWNPETLEWDYDCTRLFKGKDSYNGAPEPPNYPTGHGIIQESDEFGQCVDVLGLDCIGPGIDCVAGTGTGTGTGSVITE
jgi:hypothetical protein